MNKKLTTRDFVFISLMVAITIILDYSPLGVIPLPIVSASIVHLPTVITGIILGPVAGLIVGTIMGFTSLFHAITRPPSAFAVFFINPLISVVPRMMIGVVSYYVYAGISKVTKKIDKMNIGSTIIAAFVGSMTNTILVLGMLCVVYSARVSEMLSADGTVTAVKWALATATGQGVLEALVIVVITSPIVLAWKRYNKIR